jgi:thiol-disulfide isomerase/thioredoxin
VTQITANRLNKKQSQCILEAAMPGQSRKPRLLDILSGFTAICIVLASAILIRAVGSDLRTLFVVTGTAFFFAGVARGQSVIHGIWSHGILVSCPGLLGTAALIMNDGFHRLWIPIALAVFAILVTVSGIQTRRNWTPAREKSWLLGAVSFGAIVVVAFVAVPALSTYASLKRLDRAMPSFTLSAFDGSTVKSSDMQGHVVVLAFWATWCLPCHWELPELELVYRQYQRDPDVIFLAVDADMGEETAEKGKSFFAREKLTLPGAFDSGGAGRALRVESLPTVVLIDQQGHVRTALYGYDASEHIETIVSRNIERLLGRGRNREGVGQQQVK